MKKTQSSKLNAYLAVQTLLVLSQTIVAAVPALQAAIDKLIDLILAINLNIKIQASPSGAAQAKADALTELGDLAFEVAGSVLALADETSDPNLAARVRFSRTALTSGSAHSVVARAQDIIDATTDNLAALGDHGVTQAKLTALKQKLQAYDTLRALPRQAVAAGAAATRALERLFPQVDRLLDNQIDRLMWQFRTSDPDLYNKYLVARSIVDAPTTSTAPEPAAAAPAASPTPGAKAA